jgi:DNA-damage-inducible protein D
MAKQKPGAQHNTESRGYIMSQVPHISPFDAIRHEDENGNEYWSARELYKILGYTEWRNFNSVVIKRAMKACEENGWAVSEHFV